MVTAISAVVVATISAVGIAAVSMPVYLLDIRRSPIKAGWHRRHRHGERRHRASKPKVTAMANVAIFDVRGRM